MLAAAWAQLPAALALAALGAYRRDVADPGKDFAGPDQGNEFCWATFERLSVRSSCARWLGMAAEVLTAAHEPWLAAAH